MNADKKKFNLFRYIESKGKLPFIAESKCFYFVKNGTIYLTLSDGTEKVSNIYEYTGKPLFEQVFTGEEINIFTAIYPSEIPEEFEVKN